MWLIIFGVIYVISGIFLIKISFEFISEKKIEHFIFVIVIGGLLIVSGISNLDKSQMKFNTPLGTRVEISIDYERLNDIVTKDQNTKNILINKKDTVKTFAIREPMKDNLTIIMVKNDQSEVAFDSPKDINYIEYIRFNR